MKVLGRYQIPLSSLLAKALGQAAGIRVGVAPVEAWVLFLLDGSEEGFTEAIPPTIIKE